jgi:hypothetical protein
MINSIFKIKPGTRSASDKYPFHILRYILKWKRKNKHVLVLAVPTAQNQFVLFQSRSWNWSRPIRKSASPDVIKLLQRDVSLPAILISPTNHSRGTRRNICVLVIRSALAFTSALPYATRFWPPAGARPRIQNVPNSLASFSLFFSFPVFALRSGAGNEREPDTAAYGSAATFQTSERENWSSPTRQRRAVCLSPARSKASSSSARSRRPGARTTTTNALDIHSLYRDVRACARGGIEERSSLEHAGICAATNDIQTGSLTNMSSI